MPKERNKKTKKAKVKTVAPKKTVKKISKRKTVKRSAVKKNHSKKPQGRKILVEKVEPETILGAALFSQPELPREDMTSQLAAIRNKLASLNDNQLTNEWQDNSEINDLDQEITSPEAEQERIQEQIALLEDDNFAASQGRKTIFMYITIGVLMVILAFVWFRSTMAGIYENFKDTNALSGMGIDPAQLTPIDQALKDMRQELPAIKEMSQTQINSVLNKNTNNNSNTNQSQLQQQLIEETKNQLQNLPINNNSNINFNSNSDPLNL